MHRLTTLVWSSVPIAAGAPVTWTGAAPADEEARVVWDALGGRTVGHAALIDQVGERLFRRDLDMLGAAADVGFFRPFYLAHARRIVAALAGTCLRVGAGA